MGHGIEATDGIAWAGQRPWHGIGIDMGEAKSAVEALTIAGLDWEVEKRPVFADVNNCALQMVRIENAFATVRSDTGEALGVVGRYYAAIQNREQAEFVDALADVAGSEGGAKVEVAGSLFSGRKTFWTVQAGEKFTAAPGDDVLPYLIVTNSHDGTGGMACYMTTIRVVCNNTLTWSTNTAKNIFKIRHVGDVKDKLDAAAEALGMVKESTEDVFSVFARMRDAEVTPAQVGTTIAKFFNIKDEKELSKGPKGKAAAAVVHNYRNGRGATPGNAWGLYNAITEYVDHDGRFKSSERRMESVIMGAAADKKSHALTMIEKMIDTDPKRYRESKTPIIDGILSGAN